MSNRVIRPYVTAPLVVNIIQTASRSILIREVWRGRDTWPVGEAIEVGTAAWREWEDLRDRGEYEALLQ